MTANPSRRIVLIQRTARDLSGALAPRAIRDSLAARAGSTHRTPRLTGHRSADARGGRTMRILVGSNRRGLRTAVVAVTVGALLSLSLPALEANAATTPAFVQTNSAGPQTPPTTAP